MSTLANQLVQAEKEEISRAIRVLLRRPLITLREDPADFDLIRRRRQPLVQWFDYFCGWRLVVEARQGYARLVKVRADLDGSRPARRRRTTKAPFDRRRYVLLCLIAAELLTAPVTTIGMLAQQVIQAAAAEEGVAAFDPVRADERAAFVDALRLLEQYGTVAAIDGVTDAYLDDEDAKVLYRVDTTQVIRLLATPVPPSRVAGDGGWPDPPSFAAEGRYGLDGETTDTQRNLWARHSLIRRLLDEPVVYRSELTDAQEAYLASLTGRQIVRRAAEEAGFVLEERAEGLMLIDPGAIATDTRFPDDTSHAKVAALLLLDVLTASGELPLAGLEANAAALLDRFPAWAKAYRSDGGAHRLAVDALEILSLFGLARCRDGQVTALPGAFRYRVRKQEEPV